MYGQYYPVHPAHVQAAQAHAVQQARLNGAGTPMQQGASPVPQAAMTANQALQQQQQQQRNSPHAAANRAAASRSPMPQNPQAAVSQMPANYTAAYLQMAHAQAAQAQQAQGQKQQQQFRPVMPGHPHPQLVAQYTAANGGATQMGGMMPQQGPQAGQDQNQAHPPAMMATHYPAAMYNFPQMAMNMQHGRVPQYGWPVGMGRGMPTAANMVPQHNQQVQLGAGKTVPGGMQGT